MSRGSGGAVGADEGTVDLPLAVDWPNRPLQHVDHDKGRQAITDWKVLKRLEGETRLRLFPRTGRSHQFARPHAGDRPPDPG